MTQAALDFTASTPRPSAVRLTDLLAKNSGCARIARLLIERRGQWVDGKELARVGGGYAWRTRVSDLRKEPWMLDVKNRYRRVRGGFVVSEYRLVSH